MILYPSVDKLLERVDSRYKLIQQCLFLESKQKNW